MTTQPRVIPRYAHTAGPTSMTYSPDGKYLITVGNNEVIRKYTVASDDEPATIEQSQDGKTAVVASDDHFVVSAEDGTVSIFSMATNTFIKLLVRTSLPPRDLSISPDGLLVAVASDETVVKVVNLEDNQRVMNLRGQKNSAKHVAFHPSGNYLAVSGVDGTIYIYSLSTEEPELVKKLDGIISALKEDSESSSKVAWHPDGRAFLAQTPTRELVVVDRTNWEKHRVFANGHNGDITDYAWSPNGAFLASAGTDGKLLIWESKTQTIISRWDYKNILSLAWHPTENTISFTTSQGQLYTLPNPVPSDQGWLLNLSVRPAPLINDTGIGSHPSVLPTRSKPPAQLYRERSPSQDSLDELLPDDLDDFIEDDDGAGYVEINQNNKRRASDLPPGGLQIGKRRAYGTEPWAPEVHESFQPGSTPWKGMRRYLCLNLVGFVWTVDQETHHTVTVEFYDREVYRDFHFTDPFLYDKACLNEGGSLFSCKPKDGNGAMIYYRPHESWTTKGDWRTSMPKGEDIVSIALSDSYIVVCTTAGYVRVFTLFGVPFRVWRQKHTPVVTCASWRDYVIVMGNGAVGPDGRTKLVYTIENVKRDETLQSEDIVALPADGSIRSVCFSDNGDPCVYDSDGVLLVCLHWRLQGQAKWVPLLDTRLLDRLATGMKQESYWPVAVAQNKFHCIILKGGEKYPYFPRPLLSEFEFSIPLTSTAPSAAEAPKSDALEETFVRESVLHSLQEDFAAHTTTTTEEKRELVRCENIIDKTLLQLVAMECQDNDRGAKALEICGLFRQKRTLELAVKVAVRYGKLVLAEKIGELMGNMEMDLDV
ncbi:uncharacterized protein LAJ45_08756 [Morchella importuna]|uniref:WD40 repeat-like protein n=1 Tax=Morchella conica CCBAS932 TaxID=1392247 RepID=A0A3N4KYL0_9PEZI|nr:uncharacterized protein LAJ45_08756 [Morchella importuna]KAH8147278.1 hypothetical protein LAJ45_08756 [Morchella importuna]RPB15617.1 WD40 repeat-like protein [Morchella conica CCBAS932]